MRYDFADCTLDTEEYTLYRENGSIQLQAKVFQVLFYLLTHRERVVSKQELSEQVWPDQFISDATLEGVIKGVRRAVGDDGRTQWCIQTRRGQGYRFVAPLAEPEVAEPEADELGAAEPETLPVVPEDEIGTPSRRQLTVMFCDLASAPPLAAQLEPEDLREVTLAYHAACSEVVQRFEGHIAQYLGDGLLIFFGYPQAHEDDAQRAVHTGLGILEAMASLNARLQHDHDVELAVRLSIHTGLVVVSGVGEQGRQHPMAFGEAPHIVSQLQNLADANQMILSEHTQRLAGGGFDYEDLGTHTLPGVPAPMKLWEVRNVRGAVSRFEAATAAGLTPFVGREEELNLILRRWEEAVAGEGQAVLLTGEAGIGKSRLTQAVRERVAAEPHTRVLAQCSPYHRNSAFYPIATQIEHAAELAWNDTAAQKLDKLEALLAQSTQDVAGTAALLAPLLSISCEDRYPPLSFSPQQQRARTIEALVNQIVGLAAHQPVLYMVEDVHWCDPTSLEVLDLIVHRVYDAPVLVIITCRPEFETPWSAAPVTALTLNRLSRAQSTALVKQLTTEQRLPDAVVSQIVVKADGIPLFVEEVTKAIVETELPLEYDAPSAGSDPNLPFTIPPTLQDTLTERLDRLDASKAVAQLASTIGREFSAALLQAVSSDDEDTLQRELDRLVQAELISRRGVYPHATYVFKHALIQEAAYDSLLRRTRQRYHHQIAQAFEVSFSELAESQPEIVAHHYTEAGCHEEAIGYWQLAGKLALQRSANAEAIAHLSRGLALLEALPDTPELRQRELTLCTTIGPALIATKGYAAAEVGQIFNRAQALCQHVGDPRQLFQVVQGLWVFYGVRGEIRTSLNLSEQLLDIAEQLQDDGLRSEASQRLGITLFMLGSFARARDALEQAIDLYDPVAHRGHALLYGQDTLAASCAHLAWLLRLLGYSEQARARICQAMDWAQELTHLYSLSFAQLYAVLLHPLSWDWEQTREQAQALIALCGEHGFGYRLAQGRILEGWARIQLGETEGAIEQMQQSIEGVRATGAELYRPYFETLLAEAYGNVGQPEMGLLVLSEVETVIDKTEECLYESAVYRVKGELLLQQDETSKAEGCFQQALDIARSQQARSLELEAALSLARLWQCQSRRKDAHQLLAPLCDGFVTEGFDTAPLQAAQALLAQLA